MQASMLFRKQRKGQRMIDKILSMWKRATCKHEVDKLRFVRVAPSMMAENVNDGFEYHCAGCGKKVYKRGPVTCEKCKYLRAWKNNGATYCARCYTNKRLCLSSIYRWMWTEKE